MPASKTVSLKTTFGSALTLERIDQKMDVSLLLRVAGVGMLVAVSCQVLSKSGRDEQALLLTLTGMVVVLIMLVGQLGELIGAVRAVFGL